MRPEYTINPERRALYRRQGFWGDATLADYWHQSVRAVPDRTCVVDSQGGRYTYPSYRRTEMSWRALL